MQAIELETTVDPQHKIQVQVPDSVPPGPARVIVLFEPAPTVTGARVFGQFRGQGQLAADFDAELPEGYWSGDGA